MQFRYAQHQDLSDYASGFVLSSAPGFPAFPVRLVCEIFERAGAYLPDASTVQLWDPCCGSGYLATVLGLIFGDRISELLCSDIDQRAVELAEKNLALLSHTGMERRRNELSGLALAFDKPTYADAAAAAQRLLARSQRTISRSVVADVLDEEQLRAATAAMQPNLVMTDIPYGTQTQWKGARVPATPIEGMVRNIRRVVHPSAIIAVVGEGRKLDTGTLNPIERLRHGKRAVAFFDASAR